MRAGDGQRAAVGQRDLDAAGEVAVNAVVRRHIARQDAVAARAADQRLREREARLYIVRVAHGARRLRHMVVRVKDRVGDAHRAVVIAAGNALDDQRRRDVAVLGVCRRHTGEQRRIIRAGRHGDDLAVKQDLRRGAAIGSRLINARTQHAQNGQRQRDRQDHRSQFLHKNTSLIASEKRPEAAGRQRFAAQDQFGIAREQLL